MAMSLAYELGKDYEEILSWPLDKFSLWGGFMKLRSETKGKSPG